MPYELKFEAKVYMTVFGIESIRSPTHKIYVLIGPSVNYYYYFFNFKNKFNRAL